MQGVQVRERALIFVCTWRVTVGDAAEFREGKVLAQLKNIFSLKALH